VLGGQHDLDRRVLADPGRVVGGQRHLRQADAEPRVRVVGRAGDLEGRDHDVGHVGRVRADPEVDVHEPEQVAREPAGLEGDGAAGHRPERAVGRQGRAAA